MFQECQVLYYGLLLYYLYGLEEGLEATSRLYYTCTYTHVVNWHGISHTTNYCIASVYATSMHW